MEPRYMALLSLLSVLACGSEGEGTIQQLPRDPLGHEEIRQRASTELGTIQFIKPRSDEPLLDPYQAPILYREDLKADESVVLGIVESTGGELQVRAAQPTIYFHGEPATAELPEQRSFLWFGRAGVEGPVTVQGLRVSYDSEGYPTLYEVMRDSNGVTLVYAASTEELRATEAGSGPLPGRQFSIEPDLADQPALLVVGLVSKGQAPMGPIVYLEARSGDLFNLHCRCSPSAIREISETLEYQLVEWKSLSEELRGEVARLLGGAQASESPALPGFPARDAISSVLRLAPEVSR
jgi:hypothetical protein